jgi:Holliday junction resolvase RusA-like endonuclease
MPGEGLQKKPSSEWLGIFGEWPRETRRKERIVNIMSKVFEPNATETARRRAIAAASEDYLQSAIDPLVSAKIAASGGTLDYGAAYKAVLSERPDFARGMAEAFRLWD